MATWQKVKWIPPLFDAFNAVWPTRGKGSDGTIGDTAHQSSTSGHNPDDTPGSKSERTDADSIAEVRAADVTSLLPGVKMYDVVQRVLATPADRDRFIYIICDGWIWSASSGWVRKKYDGPDQHFGHSHFSGNPASDENAAPFASVLSFRITAQEEVDMTPEQAAQMARIDTRVTTLLYNTPTNPWIGNNERNIMHEVLALIASKVDVDPAELAAITAASKEGARQAMQEQQAAFVAAIIAGLPAEWAEQVEAQIRAVFADAGQA